ncbi:MAG: HNH endonuclease [Planctomycetes bacterium]|nr:HNH endonuclease [Planctomycetota bacterium]
MADIAKLARFAAAVHDALLKLDLPGVRLRQMPVQRQGKSAYISIGNLEEPHANLQIWEDHTGGWPEAYWYGFYPPRRMWILALAAMGGYTKRGSQGFYDYSKQKLRPATKSDFRVPLSEGGYGEFYHGVYLAPRHPLDTPTVRQAAAFYRRFADALADEKDDLAGSDAPELEGVSEGGRKRVRAHYRIERKSARIARQVKVRAGYRCEICGFSYEEAYGAVGEKYAEAHHRTPLSALKGATHVRPQGLICICASCHRMAHRLIAQRKIDGQRAIDLLTRAVRGHARGSSKPRTMTTIAIRDRAPSGRRARAKWRITGCAACVCGSPHSQAR